MAVSIVTIVLKRIKYHKILSTSFRALDALHVELRPRHGPTIIRKYHSTPHKINPGMNLAILTITSLNTMLFLYTPGRLHRSSGYNSTHSWSWGHAVAQMVEVLCHGFDSRWCKWNFPLIQSFMAHYSLGMDSTSNRIEFQEYFLGGKGGRLVGFTTFPTSCADRLETWDSQPQGNLRACNRTVQVLLYLQNS
jgi:hypothetical protein